MNGVDLRVVYISPFLSLNSLSVLLPSLRNTADRNNNSLLLLLTIILNSSHYHRKKTSSEAKKEEAFPKDWEEEVLPATALVKIRRGRCHQTQK